MTDIKKTIGFFIILILILSAFTAVILLTGCNSTVEYKEHTGIVKCDIAIMMGKMKSRKGYEAFEISEYVKGCYSEIDRATCKKENFGDAAISYDRKDDRYINYISCLGDKK